MPQVGPGVAPAHAAVTVGIKRPLVLRIPRLLDRKLPFRREQQSVAGGPRGENAVHHVDAQSGILNDLLRRTNAHEVPRLILGKMLKCVLDDLAGKSPGLAHTQSADRIAREPDLDRTLSGLLAK